VERAIIVWQGGPLRFPIDVPPRLSDMAPGAEAAAASPMLTRDELKRLERESIVRALEQTNGKVSGPGGAAELLGLRPTTLASRIAALGLKRAKAS
jgi:transcriptional regulator with GAF, ATPase, and Fis domain